MCDKKELSTAEFYTSDIYDQMIGAVDVPTKRLFEAADALGKMLCRIRKLNSVGVIYYSCDGKETGRDVIFR